MYSSSQRNLPQFIENSNDKSRSYIQDTLGYLSSGYHHIEPQMKQSLHGDSNVQRLNANDSLCIIDEMETSYINEYGFEVIIVNKPIDLDCSTSYGLDQDSQGYDDLLDQDSQGYDDLLDQDSQGYYDDNNDLSGDIDTANDLSFESDEKSLTSSQVNHPHLDESPFQ